MDAYTTALTLLSRRELSTAQLRERLLRRQCDPDEVESVIGRLTADRTLDDRRVAIAAARMQASVKGRGRRRVLRYLEGLGIAADVAAQAVRDVFGELDEHGMLERAIERRLKGADLLTLDARTKARLVRQLAAQGFEPSAVFARLRAGGADRDE